VEQLYGDDANPRFGARYRSLEILCQAAVPIEPGEGSVRRPIGDAVEQACEIRRVVVAKDVLFGAAVADAGYHRGIVEGIRKHHHHYQFASSGTSTPRPFWKVAGPPPFDAIKTSPGRNGIECAAGADVVGRLLDGVGEPARAHQRLAPIENSGPTAIKAQPAPRIGLNLIAARLAAAGRS
jgi:hypothetical protein